MKASQSQQSDLLLLGNLDLEINRLRAKISAMSSGDLFSETRGSQRKAAGSLIDLQNEMDSVNLELSRADADLKLVEDRIQKDNERLLQTSSPKDAQGIQSELETLKKRKSDLEDLELGILERKDEAEKRLKESLNEKQRIDAELEEMELANEAELMKARSGLDLLTQQRLQQASRLDSELVALYEKKLTRGPAIGRLLNRECGACRMTIGATTLTEINALASDEVATCPDCQAILVR